MAAIAAPVSRAAAPVLVVVAPVVVEVLVSELVDELDVPELLLELELVVDEPVVVVEPEVCKTPPRIDVAQTGKELARDRSWGQSLKTEDTSSELLSYQDLSLEL